MIVASLGILAGAIFSNGMMEVARKGLFYPQYFLFTEVILLFLAVMFTDVLLLDFFNTFGLPTSTTVSLVFGLLGAAFGLALMKVHHGALITVDGVEKTAAVGDFINSAKALAIISSILLSVVFSFVFGVVIQWISRLVFSFNIDKTIKYFGAIWGGIGIAAVTYFILIKGLKEATFMTDDMYGFIKYNTTLILLISFVGWTFLLQLLYWIFKTNPLKIMVLVGTFALAVAFAGNDLVNFIGVPLAGFESFKVFQQNGGHDLLMIRLMGEMKTPIIFLILAGTIMIITMWVSRKAKSVADTTLNLSRQDEGAERFGSSIFARVLVRRVIGTTTFFSMVIPQSTIDRITKRFDQTPFTKKYQKVKNPPMFDMLRASVNLMVAAILISIGTSYKLPLSTTYVTFMVAMSTSLVDGAWGRDSAVYRITGVFAVIGGWFVTALAAFSVAFIISSFLSWAQITGVIIMVVFAVFAFYRTQRTHRKREKNADLIIDEEFEGLSGTEKIIAKCNKGVANVILEVSKIFDSTMQGLIKENRKELKKQMHETLELNNSTKKQKTGLHTTISKLQQDSVETGHFYVQILDYQRELAHCMTYIVDPIHEHVENNHRSILPQQSEELAEIAKKVTGFSKLLIEIVQQKKYDKLDSAIEQQTEVLKLVQNCRKNQIKRIKNKEVGTRNSMLYFNILEEARNMLLYEVNMMKAQRDFVKYSTDNKLK